MFRSDLFSWVCLVAVFAVGSTVGCSTGAGGGGGGGGGDGGGGAPACGARGDGCETDADCCEGLTCYEWSCEPTDDGQEGDGNGGGGEGGGGAPVEHPGRIVADHTAAAAFDTIPDAYTVRVVQLRFFELAGAGRISKR